MNVYEARFYGNYAVALLIIAAEDKREATKIANNWREWPFKESIPRVTIMSGVKSKRGGILTQMQYIELGME